MTINTTKYEFSHGRKPRGYGQWMFEVLGSDGAGAYTTSTYTVLDWYRLAVHEAARRLKRECGAVKSVIEVTVLP